jgi:YaiO family outer membrane protein
MIQKTTSFSLRRAKLLAAPAMLLMLGGIQATAGVSDAERQTVVKSQGETRLETSLSYESLTPSGPYGSWKTANFSFYFPAPGKVSAFAQASLFSRLEGNGVLLGTGGYKDWSPGLYTYTALSGASNSAYLPKIRFDHDFNFKILPDKSLVITGGVTYVKYFSVHKDLLFSAGTTLYENPLILSCRAFHNKSDPGSVSSWTYLESVGFGYEGRNWTFLTVSTGRQAYLATNLATPQEVSNNAVSFMLNHRRWLNPGFGLTGDISWFELKQGYKKYGAAMGCFYAF